MTTGKGIALVFLIGHAMVMLSTHMVEAVGIKIAAYNVRIFGTSKLQNQVAMNMITQIVRQYDIIVIQEVRGFNTPDKVPNGVLGWVNQGGSDYAICNSALTYKPAAGGSSHRELYLFLYRPAVVTCVGTEESENVNGNYASSFRRPPTVGRFRVTSGLTNIEFFVVGIHTQPSTTGGTVAEINALVNVYDTFSQRYNTNIGFIMGDYNYGGRYVPSSQQDNLNIDQSPFVRFINKTDGTTVKPFVPSPQNPSKPYDRIYVVPGRRIIERVGIDTYRDMLTPEQYYRSVSDHYPVYVEVNFGTSGGNAPQNFPISQNQFTAAVTEECMSVNADFDPSLDDDLEADLYQECRSCSLTTSTGGGSQQSKRQGLMIINQ